MDEAYFTGKPFQIMKAAGSPVILGAINGESAIFFLVFIQSIKPPIK